MKRVIPIERPQARTVPQSAPITPHGLCLALASLVAVLPNGTIAAPQPPQTQQSETQQPAGEQTAGEQPEPLVPAAQEADAPPTLDELRSQVLELVDTLDADQLARRQQAERDLIALGYPALSLLPENEARFSAEARQRLRRVRLALQQQRAEAEADARTVRLGTVSTLGEALTRISDQAGIPLIAEGLDKTAPLSLSLDPLTFWPALDAVLDEAKLDINYYAGETGELVLIPRSESRPSRTDAAAYSGVFRLEPLSTTARRDFRRPELDRLNIAVEIAWEPRLTPIGLHVPLDSVIATFDDGTQLTPEPGQLDIATNNKLPLSEINLPLPLPAGSPRRITSLRGTLNGLLPGASDHFEIPLDKPLAAESVGNLTLWVEEIRPNGELHELRVEVAFADAGNAFESHRQWVFDNPAYVVDGSGERIDHLGYQVYRQTSDRVGIGYLFDLGGQLENKKFHYETPVAIMQKSVEFELKNILLP